MNETKPASQSVTLQALLVTLLVLLYQLALPFVWADRPALPDGVFATLEGAGLLIAGVGRVGAKKKLTTGK